MFDIGKDAADYIWLRGAVATIDLKLEYSTGDMIGSRKRLIGSYVPKIYIREEMDELSSLFLAKWVNGITIYYHPELRVKVGYPKIRFTVKRLLCLEWLELEGAKIIPVFHE